MLKKLTAIISIGMILFAGCDDIPNDVIDTAGDDYSVMSVTVPIGITYTDANTNITVSVQFTEASNVDKVWFNIVSLDGTISLARNVELRDNGDTENYGDLEAGDGVFTGKQLLTDQSPNGEYSVEIYSKSLSTTKKLAVRKFEYNNAQDNIAPLISELVAPDTVIVEDPKSVFLISLKAVDENGIQDIQSVYFTTIRPDGTSSGNKFFLFDDGNSETHGDESAGDGRYSAIIEVTPQNQKGDYKFVFRAIDRGGKQSNELIHTLVLQ